LLPIERGFPTIRLAGYPFTATIVASVVTAGLFLLISKGGVVRSFPVPYIPLQLFVTCTFVISAFASADVEAGLFLALQYSVTFVLNFLILYYLFKVGCRQQLVVVLCIIVGIVAVVGVLEGVCRYYLPFYGTMFLNFDPDRMRYAMVREDFRTLGTLGNPILYAAALTLSVPFALELRRRIIAWSLVGLLAVASALAVSTTAAVMWAVLAAGGFFISRRKTKLRLILAVCVAMAILLPFLSALSAPQGWLVSGWRAEISFGDDTNKQYANIIVRGKLLDQAITLYSAHSDFWSLLVGRGLKSSQAVVTGMMLDQRSLKTLDNTYATLLFESGFLGLLGYIAVGASVLLGYKQGMRRNLHWYTVLSLYLAGVAFVTIHYSTFNFVWVASVAAMHHDRLLVRSRSNLPQGSCTLCVS
jgi:hypothetical protein